MEKLSRGLGWRVGTRFANLLSLHSTPFAASVPTFLQSDKPAKSRPTMSNLTTQLSRSLNHPQTEKYPHIVVDQLVSAVAAHVCYHQQATNTVKNLILHPALEHSGTTFDNLHKEGHCLI